ncbi:hypothetical protein [Salinisphaera sp. Q1T1-3]|uniref:hypothetical protein n=1 Tax=Salinisphaera sp. Q1T1-3 TaxID=2321229 RepID=UPI000E75635A|nr:hypothetical protein [Salinisphaera sp. Q1T1-3]RJS93235.1 hypothetical protein D3260_08080 [Salinisphaera sp. Q1T1-3]
MSTLADIIPRCYAEWHHCITVDCGIDLTPAFIGARLDALNNPADPGTQRFIRTYGPTHHQAVITWFEHARRQACCPAPA